MIIHGNWVMKWTGSRRLTLLAIRIVIYHKPIRVAAWERREK